MTDRPIIFSGPMIRALLDGRKTMTRRMLKLPTKSRGGLPIYENPKMGGWEPTTIGGGGAFTIGKGGERVPAPEMVAIWHRTCGDVIVLRYQPGDRLWVRETWQGINTGDGPQLTYRATPDYFKIDTWDGPDEGVGPSFNYERCPGTTFANWGADVLANDGPWRSPIHMPRWASRLTLIVTAVKIERLQEISEADAIAEGVETDACGDEYLDYLNSGARFSGPSGARLSFASRWKSLHGSASWDSNPFVVAITFTVHQHNIDALPEAVAA